MVNAVIVSKPMPNEIRIWNKTVLPSQLMWTYIVNAIESECNPRQIELNY